MNSEKSYYSRCQEWLDGEANVTVEALETTIEKFAHQLKAAQGDDSNLTMDLQETVTLLNKKLKEVGGIDREETEQDGQSGLEANAEGLNDEQLSDYVFDPSSLTPVEGSHQHVALSEKQRKAKLNEILAKGRVTRGMPRQNSGK